MAQWSWPESVSSNRERNMIEELTQGRELASQLCRVLDHKSLAKGGAVGSAEAPFNKILGKFSNTLLILKRKEPADYGEFQVSSTVGATDSSSWYANQDHDHHAFVKSEDHSHEESCQSASIVKNRRGTHRRRKTSHCWTRDSATLTDDGQAWRKYGQKVILDAKHPRHYFRCTHKFDQACQATKHVQQIQDDPPLYRTTYSDNHTCRDYLKDPELVLDCTSPREHSSKFICFDNANLTDKQEHPFFTSSIKKEVIIKEEIPTSDNHHHMTRQPHHNHSSPYDYFVSPDATTFETALMSGVSPTIDQLDQDDVISRMMAESYEFDVDEVFPYEF